MVKLNAYVSLFLVEFVLFTCVSGHFELTIVHNNDVHAHFDEIDEYYGECSDKEAKDNACFGGEARRNWFIKGLYSFILLSKASVTLPFCMHCLVILGQNLRDM